MRSSASIGSSDDLDATLGECYRQSMTSVGFRGVWAGILLSGAFGVAGGCSSHSHNFGNPSGGGSSGSSGTTDGASGTIGGAGEPEADACVGTACNTPPGPSCTSPAELKTYDKVGSCSHGTCSYASHEIACSCQNDTCPDPCIAVTCASPPDAICEDPNTLTTYAPSGTCSAGSCSYASKEKTCDFGCSNGACKPDPCASVTCNVQQPANCKDANTKTTYAATGTCSAGQCSYTPTDTACLSNQQCGGAGVCAVCKEDASCGADCVQCSVGTKKCKDLGTTSKCVACLSNADCASPTPNCNTTTNVCEKPPSCSGLAKTCGPSGNTDCCAASLVTGGTFNRSNDASYPATVADFRLDNYEITVGRFRKFVAAYSQTMTAAGAGKNPNNAGDTGWDTAWNLGLPANGMLTTVLNCDVTHQSWSDTVGTAAAESLPINCIDWFEAEAFCIWDGGRLPTEAEWNYAAAGGTAQRTYPWGSTAPDCSHANCYDTDDFCVSPGVGAVNRVGSEPKGDGLYGQSDLAGNVWEWTQDWYANPYSNPCNNCANLTAASVRVVRGGGFSSSGSLLLTLSRDAGTPSYRIYIYGARCARTP